MLCSMPTSKSTSNWLDRLRTSKGFPISTNLDLDQFLSSNPNPNPSPEAEASDLPVKYPSIKKPDKIGDEKDQLFDLMTNVLSELFIMGDAQESPSKRILADRKSFRKQLNPKIFVSSASGSVDGSFLAGNQAVSPSSADNSVAEAKKSRTKAKKKRGSGGLVDSDLSGYSRTEVTVIDTSSPSWKSEKVVFRKGMVWRVRDKKVWSVGRKKRKVGLVERLVSEKEREQTLIELKEPGRREHLASLEEGFTQTDKREDSEETNDQIIVPRRRPKFSRSPCVPAAKDSSVLLKGSTTSRKNGATAPKSTLKAK